VINNLRYGGAEILLRDSLPLLKRKCGAVSLLVLSGADSPFEEELRNNGVDVLHTGVSRVRSPGQIMGIRRVVRAAKPDIVHVHLFPALYWTALARPRAKLVYTEHNTWNWRREKRYLRWFEALVYRRYKRVLCISGGTRNGLLKWLPSLSSKAVVVPNGIDLERFERAVPLSRQSILPSLKEGDRVLVMAASFTGKKDHSTAIRALSMLPENFFLILCGEGPTRHSMSVLAQELGLHKRVGFPGNRPDIPALFKACDYAVQSSHWEGFGLTAAEAMASGLPVIASRVEGLSETVGAGGVLFEPGNPSALAAAVMELENDPVLRESLIENARRRSGDFDIRKMVERQLEIYRSILREQAVNAFPQPG